MGNDWHKNPAVGSTVITLGWFAVLTGLVALAYAIPSELEPSHYRRIDAQLEVVWSFAVDHYALSQGKPRVEYTPRPGNMDVLAAATCFKSGHLIEFDPIEVFHQFNYVIQHSLAHEMAHLVVCELEPAAANDDAHGHLWQDIFSTIEANT